MTRAELIALINALLPTNGQEQIAAADARQVLEAIIGATYNRADDAVNNNTSVPAWSAVLPYAAGFIVEYQDRFWKSLQGDNLNHTPTQGLWWTEVSAAEAGQNIDLSQYPLKIELATPGQATVALANISPQPGGGGGGGSYTFGNGLTESGGAVELGGVLTKETNISTGTQSMRITGQGQIEMSTFAPIGNESNRNILIQVLRSAMNAGLFLRNSFAGDLGSGMAAQIGLFAPNNTQNTLTLGETYLHLKSGRQNRFLELRSFPNSDIYEFGVIDNGNWRSRIEFEDTTVVIAGADTPLFIADTSATRTGIRYAQAPNAMTALSVPHKQYIDDADALRQLLSQKGAANGYAGLDANGKIPLVHLPAVAISEFLGAVSSQAAMLALTGERGDWCVRTDVSRTYILIADAPSSLASWQEVLVPASPVTSVAGRVGAVVLTIADVSGLQAALDAKAAFTHAHTIAEVSGLQAALDAKVGISALQNAGKIYLVDEFLNGSTEAGEVGSGGWSFSQGSVVYVNASAGARGVIERVSGGTASQLSVLYLAGDGTATLFVKEDWEEFVMRVQGVTVGADFSVEVGLFVAPLTAASDGMYFRRAAADTVWSAVCRSAGLETVQATSLSYDNTTWYNLRMAKPGGDETRVAFLNGDTALTTISTNVPTASAGLVPAVRITPTTATARRLRIDRFLLTLTGY